MKPKKRLLIGNANFDYMVNRNGYFVDKTLFIKEFYDNANHVVLIPRPRRFGKTMNLSMTRHFFDVNLPQSKALFSEFNISKDQSFCEIHQNQYPVITLSFKSIRGENWEQCLNNIKNTLSTLHIEYMHLLDSSKILDFEKNDLLEMMQKKASQDTYAYSLLKLSKYLYRHHGKKVIILLDEYDTPIIEGYREGYYSQVIKFMQVFLGGAFKDNPYLEKGLITGIMRIARESIFSEMNNVGIFSLTSHYFSDKFGFTERETKDLLTYFDIGDHFEGVQAWYNGYQFGQQRHIYNPWSIINYIHRHSEGFKPHWVNTGTDSLIKKRILERDQRKNYDILQNLLADGTVTQTIHEEFVFKDFDTNKELLWTLLLFSGYLTTDKQIKLKRYTLKIPNYEVKTVFQDIIISWLQEDVQLKKEVLYETMKHLVNNRLAQFEKGFREIMGDTFSYFDIQKDKPERVYQAYLLGLLAVLGDDYIIKSNHESGDVRYDILLLPHNTTKYGIVMEMKQLPKIPKESKTKLHKRINKKLTEAAEQMENQRYYKELIAHKIKKITKVPVVFIGKEAYVNQI